MHNNPSSLELIEAVKNFINEVATPQLSGHAVFHARVASNVLDTLARDLSVRPQAEAEEVERLQKLLRSDERDVHALNSILCDALRAGEIDADTPQLLDHLKTTTLDQLKIDQPRYSGIKTATGSQ